VKLIDRYVGSQLLVTGSLAVTVLSVVLVLGNIFKKLLEVLIKNDAPLDLILSFLGYILPFSLAFTIPWGFLTAVLLVFGKMSGENELIAFRANGVSIPRVCLSVFVMAAACVGVCFWINYDIAPRAQVKMKEALYNIVTSNPLALFGSDRVISDFPDRKIYVERSNGPNLYNLLIYEFNDEFEPIKVTFAKEAQIETENTTKQLLFHISKARYEERDKEDLENFMKIRQGITMDETTLAISIESLHDKRGKSIGGMSAEELLERLKAQDPNISEKERQAQISATKTELSRRFSFSLASFAFALIGVPLAITAHRKETSVGFLFSLLVGISYFFFIIIADNLRQKPAWYPHLIMWVPNVLCIVLGGWLFLRMSRK
jgi:lipopolysaccharide export LptBFGC system permease protein LptF